MSCNYGDNVLVNSFNEARCGDFWFRTVNKFRHISMFYTNVVKFRAFIFRYKINFFTGSIIYSYSLIENLINVIIIILVFYFLIPRWEPNEFNWSLNYWLFWMQSGQIRRLSQRGALNGRHCIQKQTGLLCCCTDELWENGLVI